ncbi:RNA-binding domain-containing protein [Gyrodon lividus]|nr:RNA-binding domain-containing protein [Gyrodon lividus]
MEEGTKGKKTVFVGGIGEDVNESVIYEHFSTFGDVVEIQLPLAATNPALESEAKHRGFAFVTYASPADAQDAIDNMDLNELRGRVLKVNIARPTKATIQPGAGNRAIWESEEWLKEYAKPLAQSGGVQGRNAQRGANKAINEEAGSDDDEEAMQE